MPADDRRRNQGPGHRERLARSRDRSGGDGARHAAWMDREGERHAARMVREKVASRDLGGRGAGREVVPDHGGRGAIGRATPREAVERRAQMPADDQGRNHGPGHLEGRSRSGQRRMERGTQLGWIGSEMVPATWVGLALAGMGAGVYQTAVAWPTAATVVMITMAAGDGRDRRQTAVATMIVTAAATTEDSGARFEARKDLRHQAPPEWIVRTEP